jgi:hypothetical protein
VRPAQSRAASTLLSSYIVYAICLHTQAANSILPSRSGASTNGLIGLRSVDASDHGIFRSPLGSAIDPLLFTGSSVANSSSALARLIAAWSSRECSENASPSPPVCLLLRKRNHSEATIMSAPPIPPPLHRLQHRSSCCWEPPPQKSCYLADEGVLEGGAGVVVT